MIDIVNKKINTSRTQKIVTIIIFAGLCIAPMFMSDFRTNLLGKFIAYAILALGIDLIWGYTGILSLGHGVYFGLGAYCMAMYLKLEATKGQLPDFMSWSGQETLPWFWKPFSSAPFALAMTIIIPTLVAFIIGFLTFKNRIRGVQFSILSQALSMILVVLFIGEQAFTGGTNGITDFKTIFGLSLTKNSTMTSLYYVSLAILLITYIVSKVIIKSRAGRVLIAIRDGENRVRFSGYNPAMYKVFVYCFSAALAGIAGALFVPQVGIISPTDMGITASVEMVIWVAIGGRGTLIGAIIGAILVNSLKSGLSESFPDIWSYFIGIAFIVVVLFMPDGLVGLVKRIKAFISNKINKKNELSEDESDDTSKAETQNEVV